MKKILILLVTITMLSSCSKDDDTTDQIIGEWKLVEVKFYGLEGGNSSENSINYSDKNIIYNFNLNNQLIVSGRNNVGYDEGTYNYIFGKDYLSGFPSDGESQIILVKINDSKWTYTLSNNILKLGKSYVDGPDLYFERK